MCEVPVCVMTAEGRASYCMRLSHSAVLAIGFLVAMAGWELHEFIMVAPIGPEHAGEC